MQVQPLALATSGTADTVVSRSVVDTGGNNQPSSTDSHENKKSNESDKPTPLKKRRWLKVLKRTAFVVGYSILGLIGLAKTPGIQVLVNDILQARGTVPTPVDSRSLDRSI